jgi:L-asparaginase
MLHDRGAIFGYNLPGQKARIKLMVALSITDDPDRIRAIFEDQVY